MESDLQSLLGSCVQLYSLHGWDAASPPPPSRIWAHIRGRYWSGKVDDISDISLRFPGILVMDFMKSEKGIQTEASWSTINPTWEKTAVITIPRPKDPWLRKLAIAQFKRALRQTHYTLLCNTLFFGLPTLLWKREIRKGPGGKSFGRKISS